MTALPGSSLFASAGGERVAVVLGLEPAFPTAHVLGPAFTVQGAPGDNLALHHAVSSAGPGVVIVLAVGGEREIAHCGDIVAFAAAERGIAGIVLDGAIRDRTEIAALGFPIFHQGTSPVGPAKKGPGALGVSVEICGVRVFPGDLVCADADGVAIVSGADAAEVRAAVEALAAREQGIIAELRRGRTTVDVFGLEALE
jgi:4-hydroxy-4-methyl-2-oxoglutarate aldolase